MTLSSPLSSLFSPMSFAEESYDPAWPISCRSGQGQGQSAAESEHSTFTTKCEPLSQTSPSDPPCKLHSPPAFQHLVIQTPLYDVEKHAVCRVSDEHDLVLDDYPAADEGDQLSSLLDSICSPLTILPSMDDYPCGATDTLPSPSTTVLLNQLLDDVSIATPLLLDDPSIKARSSAPTQNNKASTTPPNTCSASPSDAVSTTTASSRAPDFVFDPQRTWSTFFVDRLFLSSPDDDVEIRAKTRRDTPCLSVPERLYSSLKYEIKQRAVGPFVTKVPFLLSRICVVDAEKDHEVRPNNRPAVKGTIEAALVKPTDKKKKKKKQLPPSPGATPPVLEGGLRPQFQDISFHSDHTLYCWHISYFAPSDLEHAILVKRSPSFKVFARKPGKLSSRKRKRSAADITQYSDDDDNNDDADTEEDKADDNDTGDASHGGDPTEQPGDAATNPPHKIAKKCCCPTTAASCSSSCTNVIFDEFVCKLDELVKCKDRLTEQERHVCLDLVVSKLLAADPSYFSALTNPSPSPTDTLLFQQQPDMSFILSSPSWPTPPNLNL